MIIVGIDLALRNCGLVKIEFLPDGAEKLHDLRLVTTVKSTGKQVRKSSDNVRSAKEMVFAIREFVKDADAIAAEIPSGAQSAAAATSFGIAIGIIAGIDKPLIEVQPRETKLHSVGDTKATKPQMIAWAVDKFPSADWLRVKRKGHLELVNANEHLADAVAVVAAAKHTEQYKFLQMARHYAQQIASVARAA